MANNHIADDRKKVRLIDANALLQSEIKRCGSIPTIGSGYINETSFKRILEEAPTVDALEVVHGRWVKCKDWDYDYKCSVCEGYAGEDVDGDHYKLTPYCPNCGAKMDGDGNG